MNVLLNNMIKIITKSMQLEKTFILDKFQIEMLSTALEINEQIQWLNNMVVTTSVLKARIQRFHEILLASNINYSDEVICLLDSIEDILLVACELYKHDVEPVFVNIALDEKQVYEIISKTGNPLITKPKIAMKYSFSCIGKIINSTPKVLKTPLSDDISDLDVIQPPDRSLINYENYLEHIGQAAVRNCMSVQYSRGCRFNCAYCMQVLNRGYYNRSASNMFDEIKQLYDIGVRRFAFVDDLPNFNQKESVELFKKIIKSKMEVQLFFPNGIRGDIVTPDYLNYMIEAGTVDIDLALESASPRIQSLINKNLDIDKLYQNLEYISHEYPNVILELQAMVGFPTETEEEALDSVSFISKIKWIDFAYIHILKIYPSTRMADIAIKNGIPESEILKSDRYAYHELPSTLPFSHAFVNKLRTDFMFDYVLNKERIKQVFRREAKILTKTEMIRKYNAYLPFPIASFDDLLKFTHTKKEFSNLNCLDEDYGFVKDINNKLDKISKIEKSNHSGCKVKVLLIDISYYFTNYRTDKLMDDMLEAPLGQMYLLTNAYRKFGSSIMGRIVKSGADYDSFEELKQIISEYSPDVIGIRSLNYYKDFCHITIALIRQWGFSGILFIGGPYATSSAELAVRDSNIDFAIVGEGETAFNQIIELLINKEISRIDDDDIVKINNLYFNCAKSSGKTSICLLNE